jgi:Fic family protein
MRPLLRLEDKQHCCAISGRYLWTTPTGLPCENVMIIEYVNKHHRITTGKAEKFTPAPRPTVKNRLSSLVKTGLLVRHGKG